MRFGKCHTKKVTQKLYLYKLTSNGISNEDKIYIVMILALFMSILIICTTFLTENKKIFQYGDVVCDVKFFLPPAQQICHMTICAHMLQKPAKLKSFKFELLIEHI